MMSRCRLPRSPPKKNGGSKTPEVRKEPNTDGNKSVPEEL